MPFGVCPGCGTQSHISISISLEERYRKFFPAVKIGEVVPSPCLKCFKAAGCEWDKAMPEYGVVMQASTAIRPGLGKISFSMIGRLNSTRFGGCEAGTLMMISARFDELNGNAFFEFLKYPRPVNDSSPAAVYLFGDFAALDDHTGTMNLSAS